MYQFIAKSMKKGEIYIAQRQSKADKKYEKSYDKDEPSK